IHDKLEYVAADYVKYGGESKRKERYNLYINQMREWAQTSRAPKKIQIIYLYLLKGKVIKDLIDEKILPVDPDNKVIDKWTSKDDRPDIYREVSNGALSAFVRFDVVHEKPNDPVV